MKRSNINEHHQKTISKTEYKKEQKAGEYVNGISRESGKLIKSVEAEVAYGKSLLALNKGH